MWIADEVVGTACSLNCLARRMGADEVSRIYSEMWNRFTLVKGASSPLWENVVGHVSVQDGESWRWIADYVGDGSLIMFIDDFFEKVTGVSFESGGKVVQVLEECIPFVFYLTNESLDFLLCFNDHDFLIAAGDACEWLRDRLVG